MCKNEQWRLPYTWMNANDWNSEETEMAIRTDENTRWSRIDARTYAHKQYTWTWSAITNEQVDTYRDKQVEVSSASQYSCRMLQRRDFDIRSHCFSIEKDSKKNFKRCSSRLISIGREWPWNSWSIFVCNPASAIIFSSHKKAILSGISHFHRRKISLEKQRSAASISRTNRNACSRSLLHNFDKVLEKAVMQADSNVSSFTRLGQIIQYHLDRVTPYVVSRWLCNLFLLTIFCLRIIFSQGFYIIVYCLGIFLLNQFLLFLSPKHDFSLAEDDANDDAPRLPTRSTDEFRPFMRRLPEFKFWYTTFKALLISSLMTFFWIFDIPVLWPVLVLYFIVLFILTMRQRISHMIKHRYLPFTYGKMRYAGRNDGQSGIKFPKN